MKKRLLWLAGFGWGLASAAIVHTGQLSGESAIARVFVLALGLALAGMGARLGLRSLPRFRMAIAAGLGVYLLASCGGSVSQAPPDPNARAIDHAMGVTYIPETVERVVAADTAALDVLLALGIEPVGSTTFAGEFPEYLGDRAAGIESIGDVTRPSLEAIARLQPDLILGTKINLGRIYKRLSRIAPTVLSEGSGRSGDWKGNLRLYAEAIGRGDRARELLQAYDRDVAQLKQQLGNTGAIEVSVVATGQGRVGFYTANSFSGSILQDLGFARREVQASPRRWAKMVSREDLDSLDGDVIFLIRREDFDGNLSRQEFASDPIWSQLEAVKQGRIYEVDVEVWAVGRNILAARQILDDIARALLEQESSAAADGMQQPSRLEGDRG